MAETYIVVTDWDWCEKSRPRLELHGEDNHQMIMYVGAEEKFTESIELTGSTSIQDIISICQGYEQIFARMRKNLENAIHNPPTPEELPHLPMPIVPDEQIPVNPDIPF